MSDLFSESAEPQVETQAPATEEPALQDTSAVEPGSSQAPVTTPASSPSTAGIDVAQYEKLMGELEAARSEMSRLQPLAEFGQSVIPYASEFNGFLATKRPAPPEPTAPAPAWNPPKPDEQKLRYFYRPDAEGNFNPIPGTPPEFVHQVESYREYIANHRKALETNPVDHLSKFGFVRQSDVEKMVNDRLSQEFQSRELHNRTAQVAAKLNAEIKDPSGKLTPWGEMFLGYVRNLEQRGISDPEEVAEMARDRADAAMYRKEREARSADALARKNAGLPPQVSAPQSRNSPIQNPQTTPPSGSGLNQLLKASGFNYADAEGDIFKSSAS